MITINEKDKKAILNFLGDEKQWFTDVLWYFFIKLTSKIEFNIKIQKASIQLICKAPFAVIGFRKKKDYFFIEFYNDSILDDCRIVKTNKQSELLIIHTLNISKDQAIDDDLISWIIKSRTLVSNI